MAFPTGWTRSCKLTIQHGQVPADATAFPVLLTAACLPDEMVTSGGTNAAQSNGGDIRFSSDSAGASQLACEIVSFVQNATPSLATAEIWVPVHVLTGSDVDIYVWYSAGGGLSQPAASASFGSQAVWDSNFKVVHHYPDGSTLSAADSTSNANNATVQAGVTAAAGKLGNGSANFNGSSTGYTSCADNTSLRPTVITLSFWIKTSQTGNTVVMEKDGNSGFSVQIATNVSIGMTINVGGAGQGISVNTTHYTPDGAWHHFGFIFASNIFPATNFAFCDGVNRTDSITPSNPSYSTGPFYVGGRASVAPTTMQLDEIRLSNVVRSTNWIVTEYKNQSSPTTFTIAGTPTTPGGGSSAVMSAMNSYRQRRV